MDIVIKKLENDDISQFKDVLLVFEDVFEMKDFKMPGDSYLQKLLERESFFVFVALKNGK